MSVRGFVLHPGQRTAGGVTAIRLFGVLESGQGFVVEDDRFRPSLYLRREDADRAHARAALAVSVCPESGLRGQPLVRVDAPTPGELVDFRRELEAAGVEVFEGDVRAPYRYMIDRGIGAAIEIAGPSREVGRVAWFENPTLARALDYRPRLRALSIDIETLPDASRVLSVALEGCGVSEVWVVSDRGVPGAEAVENERTLLARVAQRICEIDPDVITGWNVVDFDLRTLVDRAQACRVRFEIGRIPDRVYFRRDEGFTRQSRADVSGRQVLDGLGLVRDSFIVLADYRLETAARALLGRGKQIASVDGGSRAEEILRMYREDRAAFVRYNREDARLVLDILEDQALLELAVERSALTGMQLDRVGASIASFDLVYLPELHRRGVVAPSVVRERKSEPVRGGAVLDSTPGFFRNVAVFDFKSLYPSLIRTYNLDPLAHARGELEDDVVVAPNGARFARERGILPEILTDFARRRERAKARGDRHAELAIKLLMNSFFGVLGSASCRFFDASLANAITSFGQQTLLETREAFERAGARVLYGDTDSVFVALDEELGLDAATAAALALRERVQAEISARVREKHHVEPVLDLELEHVFTRFFQPSVRRGTQGSKKRYAGLKGGALEVVGLEAVRRDWPQVTKRLQLGMLERVFTDRPVLPFVEEIARALRAGGLDRDLVIRKGLRKGSVDRYTQRMAPHVEAARKAGDPSLREIRYVMTATGPEPVLEGRPFPSDIDYDYYLERSLRPVAEAILRPLGQSFDAALGRPRQMQLF